MVSQERPPITDSLWFWVLVFSLMALGALAAISGKYGRRQANIEQRYQARERIVAQSSDDSAADKEPTRRPYAMPGDTLVPLWPLAAILVVVALFAGGMLYRERGRPGSLIDETRPL